MSNCHSCDQDDRLLSSYCHVRDAAHRAFREGQFDSASRLYYEAMKKSRAMVLQQSPSIMAIDAVLEASANCMHFANHPNASTLSYQLKQSEQVLLRLLQQSLPNNFRQYLLSAYVDIMQRLCLHLARNDFSMSANAYQAHLRKVLMRDAHCRVLH